MSLPWNVNASMGGAGVNYQIQRSLRFRASATAYLSRTPSAASNRKTWTWSGWIKRGSLSSVQNIFIAGSNVAGQLSTQISFDSTDIIYVYSATAGSAADISLNTTQVFRDPSSWYHLIVAVDTTQATASNRVKIYINGSQVTAFSTATYPSLNYDTAINNNVSHTIARFSNVATNYFDGYMAEVNFIDGQQLTPASFGYNDPVTGVWQPAPFKGTYGTNGFYLPFTDIATTSGSNFGLGRDYSGNANYWNTNNISVTSGSTYDSMIDSPTSFSDGTGIYNRGNYCTLSPIDYQTAAPTNGNLTLTNGFARATVGIPSSGKWYWENTIGSSSNNSCGLSPASSSLSDANGGSGFYAYYLNGQKYTAGTASAYGASYTSGDVISVAVDADAGTVTFYKNNVSQGVAFSGLNFANPWLPLARPITTATTDINFGQRPFTYTPPTGFKALNTFNLPTPTIPNGASYMAATLYTGNGTAGRVITVPNINEVGFAWVKLRSGIDDHRLANIVTGGNKHLKSNTTDAESTGTNIIQAFSSNTFTVGNDTSVNANGSTYVGWTWAANGTAVTNTSGTISSQVSANTSSGFSIATFTGTGANATVGHGLGVAPSMIFTKQRNTTGQWNVYHSSLGNGNVIYLNLTNAANPDNTYWNATSPTSSVFTIGTNVNVNTNGTTYVAYCFAAVRGYSAFGSYTGNGSTDGPFVYTGFRPRWVMFKKTTAASNWSIIDTSRNSYNVSNLNLKANTSAAEVTGTTTADAYLDILSNGFKLRGNSGDINDATTYIYAAFAENPFNYSRAR